MELIKEREEESEEMLEDPNIDSERRKRTTIEIESFKTSQNGQTFFEIPFQSELDFSFKTDLLLWKKINPNFQSGEPSKGTKFIEINLFQTGEIDESVHSNFSKIFR